MTGSAHLRVWGQKDLLHGNAHLWIQNDEHTWRNIVDAGTMTPVSGTVDIYGFVPRRYYELQWWDTYQRDKSQQITSTEYVKASADGRITVTVTDLADDIGLKIFSAAADVNVDGVVDTADLERLAEKWLWTGDAGWTPEDIVVDGIVNFADMAALVQQWLREDFPVEIPGDVTGDGILNYGDLARIAQMWLWQGQPGGIIEDISGDGSVNLEDLAILANNWSGQ